MQQLSKNNTKVQTIKLIGRGSRLSMLQLEKVREMIESAYPGIIVQIIIRTSRGDALQDEALHTVEGSDFFTQDIFDALANEEADIAVHSLKDMSSEHFFGSNKFAVVDRDDVRDVAIFNKNVERKIRKGEQVVIGTCSPRREEMAIGFLQKSLPQLSKEFSVATKPIRGNVDTRLRKLDSGDYDGIILATAGLNRLLSSKNDSSVITELLTNKKLMLLPLIECVPAPCQGAIVVEASPTNQKAVDILNRINDTELINACVQEKKTAKQYGVGCLQKFGVTTISYANDSIVYAAGRDSREIPFSHWTGLPELATEGKQFFSSTDLMGSFFKYEYNINNLSITKPVVYVANYKAVQQQELVTLLQTKKVWAAGSKTWFELAKKGIWVEGSADAFGFEFLQKPWQMPLLKISKENVAIITNEQSTELWQKKGWKAYSTYKLLDTISPAIKEQIQQADIIFWTSFRQYAQYKDVIKKEALHSCPYGETAVQLKEAGLSPVVFPNIKAFLQWRQTSGR